MPTTYWEEEYILPEHQNIPVTLDNAQLGMRVEKGLDWAKPSPHAWYINGIYTDAITAKTGIIDAIRNDKGDAGYGWARVTWDNGKTWWYRIGSGGMYDLYIAKED
jgi:hypothetical protein